MNIYKIYFKIEIDLNNKLCFIKYNRIFNYIF